jgi:transposase-like protein
MSFISIWFMVIGISSIKEESDKVLGEQCPYCKSKSYIANGSLKGVQRYKCKEYGRFFSETTGTALEGLHKKDKFSKYLWCMFMGYSIRKCV